jgi:hypothetical protein
MWLRLSLTLLLVCLAVGAWLLSQPERVDLDALMQWLV